MRRVGLVELGFDVEVRDETGDRDEAGHRRGGGHEDETTAFSKELLVYLEHNAEPARIDERHAGEIDANVAGIRRTGEFITDLCLGVSVDLADENDASRAPLDS